MQVSPFGECVTAFAAGSPHTTKSKTLTAREPPPRASTSKPEVAAASSQFEIRYEVSPVHGTPSHSIETSPTPCKLFQPRSGSKRPVDILEIGGRKGGKKNRVCGACGLEQGSNWSKHWKTRHPATNKRDWTELQDKGPTEPQWVQKPEGPHDKVFAGGQYQFWPEKRRAMLLDSFLEQGMVRFCFRDILWEMCKEMTINP